jgi:hypothetical protein
VNKSQRIANQNNSLFSHCTLISVTRRLIVMRIGNQTSDETQQRKRFDFEMCRVGSQFVRSHSNQTIVLFIHINKLDISLSQNKAKKRIINKTTCAQQKHRYPFKKSANVMRPRPNNAISSGPISGAPLAQISSGRHSRPPSEAMCSAR